MHTMHSTHTIYYRSSISSMLFKYKHSLVLLFLSHLLYFRMEMTHYGNAKYVT